MSDFGLSTGFHWSHDVKYYEGRRKAAMQLMAKKIDEVRGIPRCESRNPYVAKPKLPALCAARADS